MNEMEALQRRHDDEVALKVKQAIAKIIFSYVWWSSLLLRLKIVPTRKIERWATNGSELYYNPDYFHDLLINDIVEILLHAVAHCALLHPYRRNGRDRQLWNMAADQAVNALLVDDGLRPPEGSFFLEPADLAKTAEEYYADWAQSGKGGGGAGQDSEQQLAQRLQSAAGAEAYQGDVLDSQQSLEEAQAAGAESRSRLSADDWRAAMAQAYGRMPGALRRQVQPLLNPEIDWRTLVNCFLSSLRNPPRRTWSRRSRRVEILPGKYREPEYSLAVVVDSSGSITDEMLQAFVREVSGLASMQGFACWWVSADCKVQSYVEPGAPPPDDWPGGGGTDFRPAIEFAAAKQVDGVIYFTDGYGEYPSKQPDFPVIWIMPHPVSVPFGKTVKLAVE